MTILFTNPKRSGQLARITIIRPDGVTLIMHGGSNSRRYANRHRESVIQRAGELFAAGLGNPMSKLFARCKGRVEAMRKIDGMGPAVWEGME